MNAHSPIFTQPALSITERNRLAGAWRGSLRELDEHIDMIKQHRETIAQRNEILFGTTLRHRPAYVEHVRAMLALRLPRYLAAVRRVSEYEAAMNDAGISFARAA